MASTYGAEGITVAIRIGFDDNRSLGPKETGGRVALPVFRELMLRVYRDKLAGPLPLFPPGMEQRITRYLQGDALPLVVDEAASVAATGAARGQSLWDANLADPFRRHQRPYATSPKIPRPQPRLVRQ